MRILKSIVIFLIIVWIFPFIEYIMQIPNNSWIISPLSITYIFGIFASFVGIINAVITSL